MDTHWIQYVLMLTITLFTLSIRKFSHHIYFNLIKMYNSKIYYNHLFPFSLLFLLFALHAFLFIMSLFCHISFPFFFSIAHFSFAFNIEPYILRVSNIWLMNRLSNEKLVAHRHTYKKVKKSKKKWKYIEMERYSNTQQKRFTACNQMENCVKWTKCSELFSRRTLNHSGKYISIRKCYFSWLNWSYWWEIGAMLCVVLV